MKKWIFATVAVAVLLTYMLGPTPGPQNTHPEVRIPSDLVELETFINQREQAVSLKPDNEARIIWNDSSKKEKTPVSVVYIHGFSASYGEGEPFHRNFAKALNANLFVARLAHHGLTDKDAFKNAQAEDFMASTAEAIEIGRKLGDRVIVLATSMGGALSLHEVARNQSQIAALMVFSPLIDFRDPTSFLLDKPWGETVASWVVGGDYYPADKNPSEKKSQYWYSEYHIGGLVAVKNTQALTSTKDVWEAITIPVFVGYYYKNDDEQDETVSVKAILGMTKYLGTRPKDLQVVNFPNAADHVITSEFTTKNWPGVLESSLVFAKSILGI